MIDLYKVFKKKWDQYAPESCGALLCLSAGMLDGLYMDVGPTSWHSQLVMPWFNPPNWVFGPVWTLLYLLMGIALGKLWKNRAQNPRALVLFFIQLILNLAWSPIFFHMHKIDWALWDLMALCAVTSALLWATRKNRTIFFLLLPYMLWISFACLLNWGIYEHNVLLKSSHTRKTR
jgi:benzodiazapine receptor